VRHLPGALLFWLNTISAVVDNATLAAVEIGPALGRNQQRLAMLGLLISVGMLIPGNVPNMWRQAGLVSPAANGRAWRPNGNAAAHSLLRSFGSHGRLLGQSDPKDESVQVS
jgi:hypothetical protein